MIKMKWKRLWWTFRMHIIRNAYKRADYARAKDIYASIGSDVSLQICKVPLYSKLIKFHNNIAVARNVDFVTHDVIHCVLNRNPAIKHLIGEDQYHFEEHIGCIEIMDNVFIGSNSIILDGVRIGPNAIIASGSIVTKDVSEGAVVAGIPAHVICSVDDYVNNRIKKEKEGCLSTTTHNQELTCDEVSHAWTVFIENHQSR